MEHIKTPVYTVQGPLGGWTIHDVDNEFVIRAWDEVDSVEQIAREIVQALNERHASLDLLAACEAAFEMAEYISNTYGRMVGDTSKVQSILSTAIAKAKGE